MNGLCFSWMKGAAAHLLVVKNGLNSGCWSVSGFSDYGRGHATVKEDVHRQDNHFSRNCAIYVDNNLQSVYQYVYMADRKKKQAENDDAFSQHEQTEQYVGVST